MQLRSIVLLIWSVPAHAQGFDTENLDPALFFGPVKFTCSPVDATEVRLAGDCESTIFHIEFEMSLAPEWLQHRGQFDYLFDLLSNSEHSPPAGMIAGFDFLPLVPPSVDQPRAVALPSGAGFCQFGTAIPRDQEIKVWLPKTAEDAIARLDALPVNDDNERLRKGLIEDAKHRWVHRCFLYYLGLALVKVDFFPLKYRQGKHELEQSYINLFMEVK